MQPSIDNHRHFNSFKYVLSRQYGTELPQLVNAHNRDISKLARWRNCTIFLRRCKVENLVPRGFRLSNRFGPTCARILTTASCRLLAATISSLFGQIFHTQRRVEGRWARFCQAVSPQHQEELRCLFTQCYHRSFAIEKANKLQKLAALRQEASTMFSQRLWPNKQFWDSLVINQTQVQFTDNELDILALGPKFAVFPKKLPISDIVAGVQSRLSRIPSGRDALAAGVTAIVQRARMECNLSHYHQRAVSSIKRKLRANDIILLNADKGAKTVVLAKATYVEKMNAQLQDRSQYEIQRRNCNPLRQCHIHMSEALSAVGRSTQLLTTVDAAKISLPYGLPKIHKEGSPLRIIVPMVGGVTYNLSKHLDRLLRPVVNSLPHRIQSAEKLLEDLSGISGCQDYFMGSLDVVALFPNVDVPFLLQKLPDFLQRRVTLWRNDENPLGQLSPQALTSLIGALCQRTYFKFEGRCYRQLRGVPMGSPVSVVLSEIFMHFMEAEAMRLCPTEFKPLFYGRYIDDILVVSGSKAQFESLFGHMNTCCPNLATIRFTKEEEVTGKLPFLDILINRLPGPTMRYSVYRKKTHSNRYCHPTSAMPASVFCGILRTMRLRGIRYCSNDDLLFRL